MPRVFTMHQKQNTLRGKLFGYMLLLAVILVFCVFMAMFLLGQFTDIKVQYYETLDMQRAVLAKEITDYYENAVISATQLSVTTGKMMDATLAENNLTFEALTDNQAILETLQDSMFDPLKNGMSQAGMSGAFVVWDTTINSAINNASSSRNGLFLQLDSRSIEESTVIIYRGNAEVGKRHGAMPHRKWRLEYDVADIPNLEQLMNQASLPLDSAHRISSVFNLPGTTEKAILITVPIIGQNGTVYGICGFELGQMYFKERFSQPSTFGRMTCLFVPNINGHIDPGESLSSGIQNGYYYAPAGSLVARYFGNGLTRLVSENNEYIGVTQKVVLTNNSDESLLVVMIPKDDYDSARLHNNLKMLLTILLLAFFAVVASLRFSKRFIAPIKKGLEHLHDSAELRDGDTASEPEQSGFHEIDELVAFVRNKMQNASENTALPSYMEKMFNRFIELTGELTPTEMNALSLLIEGHDPKELHTLLYVSEGTAKQHVLKIYKKLDVSSRGELLLYIQMLKGCGIIDKIRQ